MIHERHASAQLPSVCVSGVEFSRDARDILGGSDGVRTMAFSTTVRTVRQGSFSGAESLSSVILNEGLEVLGTDERKPGGETLWHLPRKRARTREASVNSEEDRVRYVYWL